MEDISISGGLYFLNFSSLGESVLLSGVSKQHHYQASEPWRTHRNTLDSSTNMQHGDGRRQHTAFIMARTITSTAQAVLHHTRTSSDGGRKGKGCEQW